MINKLFLTQRALVAALFSVCFFAATSAMGAEEKLYRTGIEASPRYFSVSPGGESLVFDTRKPLGGMRMLDLASGKIKEVWGEAGHMWEMGRWSNDGKHLVAVSTSLSYNGYDIDSMKVILIDPTDWSWKTISKEGEGVKITPFFSPDGAVVYYFRGKKRTEGRTPASKYELYAINLASQHEEKLTDDKFYETRAGDVSAGGKIVYFSKFGGRPLVSERWKSENGFVSNSIIVSLDVQTRQLRITDHFDNKMFIEISEPRLDGSGRIYFIGTTQRKRGGPFVWSLFRDGKMNQPVQRLTDFSIVSQFDIAKHNGDIYVSDVLGKEVVFRRLAVNANQ